MDLVDGDDKNSIKDNHAGIIDGEVNSPPPGQSVSPAKGFGLKKWKRIKRLSPNNKDKDAADPVEDKLFLKRNLSGSTTPTKPLCFSSAEINRPNTTDATLSGSSLDSRLAVEASESENSEDRSSRSSTAASVPKVSQEKNRMKNLIAKNVASSNGGVRKGVSDNSKKHRGERKKLDEENSQSSLESDSRSSNLVFAQGAFTASSNGGRSVNYGGENSGETYTSQQMFNDEVQTAYGKENVSEIDKKNHQGSPIHDPLVESIRAFQSVQEALEKEVHKLGAIGKESASLDAGFMESCEPSSSDQLASENFGEKTLETSVLTMTQKVKYLEHRLEEANAVLSQKETRIAEMEAIVNQDKLPESGRETLREMELEFECLFQQKMEAEIEYLALTRATQKKPVFELEEVENKTAMLKKEAEKVEKYFQDIKGTEEISKMQRRVWKISFCFFVQLILLLLVFLLFAIELDPQSEVVVPT